MCAAMGTQYSVFARVSTGLALAVATPDAINAQVVALNLGVFFGDKCIDGSSL